MNPYSPYGLSFFDGVDVVAVMEVYADASEIGGHLAIGALLFRKKNVRPFEKEWRKMLRKYHISHFHMTDCNAGQGEFRGKSDSECDKCARCAIQLLIKYAEKGTIFSVKESDFYDIVTENGIMPNPFTLGAWVTLFDIAAWSERQDRPPKRITYVFEAGDRHQSDANIFLNGIALSQERRARFRYSGHAFLPKLESLPTQAADILAWHGAKHWHRKNRGNDRLRGDFAAIVDQLQVSDANHDRNLLEEIVAIAKRNAGDSGNQLAGLAYRAHNMSNSEMARRLAAIVS